MKLIYTITAEDRRQSQLIYDSVLAPTRWLAAIAEPFTFVALGLGIYYYMTGNWILAISLFASFAYLFSKGFLLRFIRNLLAGRTKSELQHFQLETGNSGIAFSAIGGTPSGGPASAQKQWSEFRAYCQTPDMFVLSAGRTFYVIPKRLLTAAEISEFQTVLRSRLSQMKVRTGPRVLRHAVSIGASRPALRFFFFGGMIEGTLWWSFRPFLQRNSLPRSATVRLPQPASRDELHGMGQIYLVPFGDTTPLISASLLQYYRGKYGLTLDVLPSIPVPEWARDEARHQVVAEELIEAMRRAYPQQAATPDSILIGVTDEDMYIAELDWEFAFNFRETHQTAVISTARLNPVYYGRMAAPAVA